MTRSFSLVLSLVCLSLVFLAVSCGNVQCTVVSMTLDPQAGTADHTAAPPGNQATFVADGNFVGHCTVPGPMTPVHRGVQDVVWSVSDTTNVSISNRNDQTFGTATCLGPTAGAATVTATLPANKNHGRQVVTTGTITCF